MMQLDPQSRHMIGPSIASSASLSRAVRASLPTRALAVAVTYERNAQLAAALALPDQSLEERAIDGVLRTLRILCADEGAGTGDLDHHAAEVDVLGVLHDVRIADAAGAPHEVDGYLIGDAHDHVLPDIGVGDLGCRVVGKNAQSLLQACDVLRRVIAQEIDVLREAARAMNDDGKAPDQDVAGASVVQRAADAD